MPQVSGDTGPYGEFMNAVAAQIGNNQAQQGLLDSKQAYQQNEIMNPKKVQEADQLLTLNKLRLQQAERENEIATATHQQALQTAQTQADTAREKAIDDYAQQKLDSGVDGQTVVDELIRRGTVPEGTIASKVAAPWDTTGETKVWAFKNPLDPSGEWHIQSEELMRQRYKDQVASKATAQSTLNTIGLSFFTKPDGTTGIRGMDDGLVLDRAMREKASTARAGSGMSGLPDLAKLQLVRAQYLAGGTPESAPEIKQIDDQIKKLNENAFQKSASEASVKTITENQDKAKSAVLTLQSNQEAIDILDSGVITGTGAEWITGFGKALQQAGFTLMDNPTDNAQAYAASAAKRVAEIITAFGSGTGLSDADREYARNAAAGDITMTEGAIRKIIDINNRAAQGAINSYNADISKLSEDDRNSFAIDPEIRVSKSLMELRAEKKAKDTSQIDTLLEKYK